MSRSSLRSLYLLGAAFFLSGFATLTYEVVWQRVLVRLTGAGTPSVSFIICMFMGGLALGGLFGAKISERTRQGNFLIAFALVEFLVGICGLISIFVSNSIFLPTLTQLLGASTIYDGASISVLGWLIVLFLLIVPATLMGATLPIVAGHLAGNKSHPSSLGRFYAVNTTGAVFGAFVAGFFLLPWLGIGRSLIAAAGCNMVAASLAYLAAEILADEKWETAPDTASQQTRTARSLNIGYALLVALTGFLGFVMEIVWFRFLVLIYGSSTYATSLVLSVYIGGLALGAWCASAIARRVDDRVAIIPFVLASTALALSLNLFQYQAFPALYLGIRKAFIANVLPGLFCDALLMLVSSCTLIVLPALLIGMVLPLILVSQQSDITGGRREPDKAGETIDNRAARSIGILYAANVIGCMVGSLCTGTMILPAMAVRFTSGMEVTTMIVICCYALASLLFLFSILRNEARWQRTTHPEVQDKRRIFMRGKYVALVLVATLILVNNRPPWDTALMSSGLSYIESSDLKNNEISKIIDLMERNPAAKNVDRQAILMYREGVNSTISVVRRPVSNLQLLKSNGKSEASIPIRKNEPAPDSDLPTQTLLGLIPTFLCPGEKLDGLVLGYGSGTTCSAIQSAPWVRQTTAVEIERAVWSAAKFFPTENRKNFSAVSGDARTFLAGDQQEWFDFIVSQPSEPWLSGSSDLYTREFYQLAAKRLKQGGVFCQWVPLYMMTEEQLACLLKTFQSVYPETIVWRPKRAGELILTGSNQPQNIDINLLKQRMSNSVIHEKLAYIGIDTPLDLAGNAIFGGKPLRTKIEELSRRAILNTDDNLAIEFKLAADMGSSQSDIESMLFNVLGPELYQNRPSELVTGLDPALLDDELAIAFLQRKLTFGHIASDSILFPMIQGASVNTFPAPDLARIENYFKKTFNVQIEQSNQNILHGRYLMLIGKPVEAKLMFSRVSPDKFTSYTSICDLASVLLMTGDYQQALQTFEKASVQVPDGVRALTGKGLCQWLLNDVDKAETTLAETMERDPHQFLARYALAQIMTAKALKSQASAKTVQNEHDFSAALNQMRQASRANPGSPHPGVFVTAFYVREAQWKDASSNLQLVLRRKSNLVQVFALGYLIADRTGDREQLQNFKNRYREMVGSDITSGIAEQILNDILTTPFIVRKVGQR